MLVELLKKLDNHDKELIKKQTAECEVTKAEQTDVLDKIRSEIKEWYWQVDKQALAKDPCVVDAMVDLFIRTINKYKAESEEEVKEYYEWCHDCKEYDTENHCCHRYSSFIRESLQDSIDAVLEDIKEEILKEINNHSFFSSSQKGLAIAYKIIDKHISRKGMTEKSCSNCKFWCLDKNDKNRPCRYCYCQDEWQAESEKV